MLKRSTFLEYKCSTSPKSFLNNIIILWLLSKTFVFNKDTFIPSCWSKFGSNYHIFTEIISKFTQYARKARIIYRSDSPHQSILLSLGGDGRKSSFWLRIPNIMQKSPHWLIYFLSPKWQKYSWVSISCNAWPSIAKCHISRPNPIIKVIHGLLISPLFSNLTHIIQSGQALGWVKNTFFFIIFKL